MLSVRRCVRRISCFFCGLFFILRRMGYKIRTAKIEVSRFTVGLQSRFGDKCTYNLTALTPTWDCSFLPQNSSSSVSWPVSHLARLLLRAELERYSGFLEPQRGTGVTEKGGGGGYSRHWLLALRDLRLTVFNAALLSVLFFFRSWDFVFSLFFLSPPHTPVPPPIPSHPPHAC